MNIKMIWQVVVKSRNIDIKFNYNFCKNIKIYLMKQINFDLYLVKSKIK